MKAAKFKMPHMYVIIFIMILIGAALTYILPAGSFARVVDEETGRTLVQAGTYTSMPGTPISLYGLLQAIPKGMVQSASVIMTMFIFGGSFGIINATGAIESGIENSITFLKNYSLILIPVLMIIFAIMGGFLGMINCLIVFIPLCVLFSRALGYDAMVGYALLSVANNVGFSCGPMCIWNVGIAQEIAELPLFSAFGLRMAMFAFFVGTSIIYIMWYALRVRKNPETSVIYDIEKQQAMTHSASRVTGEFTTRRKIVLLVVAVGFIGLTIMVLNGYSSDTQIGGYLLGLAILAGFVNGFGPSEIADAFVEGARDIVVGALVVGLARATLVILTESNVIDTVLYAASNMLSHFTSVVSAVMMFIFQFFFNFIIPSGSGQAATTMPLMVPIGDLCGVTRQTSVVAFQMGDGLSNILWPNSLLASLSMAGIPYQKWLKWFMPLMIFHFISACILVAGCQLVGLGPF